MNAQQLLRHCRDHGIELYPNGDKLRVIATDGIDDDTKAELIRLKPEVLALLRSANRPALPPELAPVLAWLHFIGENSQEIIGEVLDKCRRDPGALAYYLERARELPLPRNESPEDSQVTCGACIHFRPDPINPPAGIGACSTNGGRTGPNLWPMARRWCGQHTPTQGTP